MTEDEMSEYVSILTRDFKSLFPKETLLKAAKARVPLATV